MDTRGLKRLRRSLLAKTARDSADNFASMRGLAQTSPSKGMAELAASEVERVYIHESSKSAHLGMRLPVLFVPRPHVDQEIEKT